MIGRLLPTQAPLCLFCGAPLPADDHPWVPFKGYRCAHNPKAHTS
jgi:hypothetical protein